MVSHPFSHKVHPRAKNLKLRVLTNGQIQVTTPRWTPKWQINQFVKQNHDWIEKQLAKIRPQAQTTTVPTAVSLFGKDYQFFIKYDPAQPVGIYVMGKHLILNPTDPAHADGSWPLLLQKKLDRFLKTTAAHYILPRTEQLAKQMKLNYNRVALKEQSSRWGSCSSQKNLNFNWRLVHTSPEIIDYVIIHELSHLQEMNHSHKFWELVEKYDPAYKTHRGWLKRNGSSMAPC